MTTETSAVIWLHHEELLLYAACVCHCCCLCLRVCVCLEYRRGGGGRDIHMASSWRWQLSRVMRLALRWCRLCRLQRGSQESKEGTGLWSYSKLLLRSLYFNSLSNSDTLLDCVFEPVYWIVDHITHWFGVVGCLIITLDASVLFPCCLPHPLLSSSHRCLSPWSYCSQPQLWLSSTCSSYP